MDSDARIPPWQRLGIDADADVATVRRAYAARIKVVRPDVDPIGFQMLVAARDDMLRWAREGREQVRPIGPDTEAATADAAPRGGAVADVLDEAPAIADAGVVRDQDALHHLEPDTAERAEPVIATEPPSGVKAAPVDAAEPSTSPPAATDAYDIVVMLRDGRSPTAPLAVASLEGVLAGLPVGGGRWYESDVIEALSEAVEAFDSGPSDPGVLLGYEHAACLLAEHFAWEERDRAIHETLSREAARDLLVFLGRAYRRHSPDYRGRFYRLEATADTAKDDRRPWFNWRTVFLWWLAFTVLANLGKCAHGG